MVIPKNKTGHCVSCQHLLCKCSQRRAIRVGKHVLRYLIGTASYGLSYWPHSEMPEIVRAFADKYEVDPFKATLNTNTIIGWSDASFADIVAFHFFGAFVITIDAGIVTWKCGKQGIISASTAESEMLAASEAFVATVSTQTLVEEILPSEVFECILAVDNAAAVSLLSPAQTKTAWRTRHLRIRAAVISESEIQVLHCPGEVEIADLLTKALPAPRLLKLYELIGLKPVKQESDTAIVKLKLMMKGIVLKPQLSSQPLRLGSSFRPNPLKIGGGVFQQLLLSKHYLQISIIILKISKLKLQCSVRLTV